MAQSALDDLIRSATRLASLPDMYRRIDLAVNDPASSLDDIGNIIMEDPALAARLLKIANSSLFGFPHPISTITRALTVIGTAQLRDLVMATSVLGAFSGVSPELVKVEEFWKHSIACGLAARVIATFRRVGNVEAFYVAGLLHDIGKLVLFQTKPRLANLVLRISRENRDLFHSVEQARLGFTHAEVGGAILTEWKLPERIVIPIRYHHTPGSAVGYEFEAAVVHVADILATGMAYGSSGEGALVPPLEAASWELLELPVSSLPVIERQIRTLYSDAVQVFLR